MSREERMTILQMVQEGKITAEEAANLLRTIESVELRETVGMPAMPATPATPATPAEPGSQPNLGSIIPEGGLISEDILTAIKQGIFGLFGSGYQFEEDLAGEFVATGPVRIDFGSSNGRIEVKPWDQPGYRLHLTKSVRAADRAAAEEAARDMVEHINDANGLVVRVRDGNRAWSGLVIEALIPRDRVGDLNLHTSNGRIEVSGVTCQTCRLHSSNGRIVADGIAAREAALRTSNGSITASGLRGPVDASTSNGSITIALTEASGDVKLHTSNGSIRCQLPAAGGSFDIEARTSMGSITADVANLEIVEQSKHTGSKFLRAHTRGFDTAAQRAGVRATTSNGSVTISTL